MNIGTVMFYDVQRGFGFIQQPDGGNDVFVHASAIDSAGLSSLTAGQKLRFKLERDSKGWDSAANLRLI